MDFKAEFISYSETGFFSKIITDYTSQPNLLTEFFEHPATLEGIKSAITKRKNFTGYRQILADQLQQQYQNIDTSDKVKLNIDALKKENTFTICTAHQPNIFTGHLYFIYKIIHTIKLANTLNLAFPDNKFIPVFYVGSEDADIEELGEVSINGEKYKWHTKQTGAVGRMYVDNELLDILKKIKGQLFGEPFGQQIIQLLSGCYVKGATIQNACFNLVNRLFGDEGLIVLLPDNVALKNIMLPVFEDDIFNNKPSEIVNNSSVQLSKKYKVQAHPRAINLFYLKDNIRNRIVQQKDGYTIQDTALKFTKEELQTELEEHPERFSPNVILRALYQETILPNIAFIGGGGEIAYWLELKDMFKNYGIPYPVLILRNSFLLINTKINSLINKFSFSANDIFKQENDLVNSLVKKNSSYQLSLEQERQEIKLIYEQIKNITKQIDVTLAKHAEALQTKALTVLTKLEVKMLKAEKKKFTADERQIKKIKENLFPHNILQERVENFIPFYAQWGAEFITSIYKNSLSFEQKFCIIIEDEAVKS